MDTVRVYVEVLSNLWNASLQ